MKKNLSVALKYASRALDIANIIQTNSFKNIRPGYALMHIFLDAAERGKNRVHISEVEEAMDKGASFTQKSGKEGARGWLHYHTEMGRLRYVGQDYWALRK